jgi:hypothetical protein
MCTRTVSSLIALTISACPAPVAADGSAATNAQDTQLRLERVPQKVLAFYYPWYGNPSAKGGSGQWFHWADRDPTNQRIGNSTHYPKLGPYDSHDAELIALFRADRSGEPCIKISMVLLYIARVRGTGELVYVVASTM